MNMITYLVRGNIGSRFRYHPIGKSSEKLTVHFGAGWVLCYEVTQEDGPEIILPLPRKVLLETHGSLKGLIQ